MAFSLLCGVWQRACPGIYFMSQTLYGAGPALGPGVQGPPGLRVGLVAADSCLMHRVAGVGPE